MEVNQEAAVMEGNPPQQVDIVTPEEENNAPAPEATRDQPQAQPVYFNGKKFNNTEELMGYMSEQELRYQALNNQISKAPDAPTEKKIEDIWFEDPSTAIKMIREDIKKEIFSGIEQKDSARSAWNKFYDEYSDLKGQEDLVKFKTQELSGEIRNLNDHEAGKRIASEVRSMIQKIRGTETREQNLPSGPAKMAGASGSTPARAQAQPTAPISFAEQVKKFQRRGTK